MNELSLQRKLTDVVVEYDHKLAGIPQSLADFEAAGNALKMSVTIGGTFGNEWIDTGLVSDREMKASLLKSAWGYIYEGLNIDRIASASDKRKFQQAMASPPPFTLDNVVATFEGFVTDPRGNILRGLAEVFCDLDQAYKSHDKVKIGVEGLPKRIVLRSVSDYGGWGRDQIQNVLNAIAAYQGKPLVEWQDISSIMKNETALLEARGLRLRRFKNGNGHLIFEPDTLRDINRALAEFYGDVLPDTTEERPDRPSESREVSKDLQYYPTPMPIVERIIDGLYRVEGEKVLEPSCGCGRIMDGLRKAKAKPFGIEVDPARADQCRRKGHAVLTANFLETAPTGDFDRVVMNPPFYGKHYAKHVNHALKFLKPGGSLISVLPARRDMIMACLMAAGRIYRSDRSARVARTSIPCC